MQKAKPVKRKIVLAINYVPSIRDSDVIKFLKDARAKGENVTQLITDAIRLKMKEETK